MKILVTGGAGFIASHVVDSYITKGYEAAVVDNLFTGKRQNLNPSAQFYLMDIRSELLKEVFELERPDIVNHHAAQPSVPASVENPLFDADVNIIGLLNLLEYSVKYGIKKIIFISSGGAIYGEARVPTPEEYTPHPCSPYAISKFISEQYLNFYRDQYGLDFTVLRYSNIYGPRQVSHGEAGVVAIFMEKVLKGDVPTIYHYEEEPEGMMRDYCYVEDVTRANILALERGSGEAFNIGTGVGTVTADLYRTILTLMKDFGYAKESFYDKPHKGHARPGDIRKSCLDIRKATNSFSWSPEYDLKSGLAKTLNWLLIKTAKEA